MRLVEDRERRHRIIFNVVVLLIAFISIAKRNSNFENTSAFENFLVDSFAPIQESVSSIRLEFSQVIKHYLGNIQASKNNIELNKQIAELESEIFKLNEIERENLRLKELLQFGNDNQFQKILAQVVAWDSNSDYRVLRINKGIKNGVQLQAPVITSHGLVGYIYRLTNQFADVLTILDSNNRIDGIVQRVRAHGIVEGYSNQRSFMKYVSRAEPLILGDIVITSGLGNIYPKGIKVGTVSRIERESYGITQNVEITPAVDFNRLEEVVILKMEGEEQKNLEWSALDKMDDMEEDSQKR